MNRKEFMQQQACNMSVMELIKATQYKIENESRKRIQQCPAMYKLILRCKGIERHEGKHNCNYIHDAISWN